MKEFVFDPRMLISQPFTECPKCHQITFGILRINNNSYNKRCKNCMYPDPHMNEYSFTIPLPQLTKKVIYLDQMAISNMMKALNPATKAFSKIDKIWLQLFEKLDKLCKMQLVVCPFSNFHEEESSFDKYFKSVEKMYNLLSGGIKFENELQVRVKLVNLSLNLFLDGKQFTPEHLTQDLAFFVDINIWQDKLIMTLQFDITAEDINQARQVRNKTADGFNDIFKKWQTSGKTFQEFIEIEENAWTSVVSEDIYLLYTINSIIKNRIQDPQLILKTFRDFFNSEQFKSIPISKISSYMFAGIARKATQGQARVPSKGMLNDISIISTYLPFCDAMFLDNECVALLKENPTGDYIRKFKTKLFSKNSITGFLEFLDNVEKNVSGGHIIRLKEVYGDNWNKPYTTLYKTN